MNENSTIHIKQLLDRYYSGQASETEENTLKEYFARPDSAPEFDDDKAIFAALVVCSDEVEVPSGLEARLSEAIDAWALRDAPKRSARFLSWKPAVSIAASIAIVALIGVSQFVHRTPSTMPSDSVTDPEVAYAETQRALTMLVTTLDKGVEGVETAAQLNDNTINNVITQLNNI